MLKEIFDCKLKIWRRCVYGISDCCKPFATAHANVYWHCKHALRLSLGSNTVFWITTLSCPYWCARTHNCCYIVWYFLWYRGSFNRWGRIKATPRLLLLQVFGFYTFLFHRTVVWWSESLGLGLNADGALGGTTTSTTGTADCSTVFFRVSCTYSHQGTRPRICFTLR